jgi:hypothetical protein
MVTGLHHIARLMIVQMRLVLEPAHQFVVQRIGQVSLFGKSIPGR